MQVMQPQHSTRLKKQLQEPIPAPIPIPSHANHHNLISATISTVLSIPLLPAKPQPLGRYMFLTLPVKSDEVARRR